MASSSIIDPSSATVDSVLQALDSLYKTTDPQTRSQANNWLQEFQKTPQAWEMANQLLLSQELALEPRVFAAQTFRSKVTYDLSQLPSTSYDSLKSTLINSLSLYSNGPRIIQTQLSLAISGLALQMTNQQWPKVIPDMIETFGNDPSKVALLLEFLTVLPEEVNMNHRIPIENDAYNARMSVLLSESSQEVLRLLSMYIQAEGLTTNIQNAIFSCLGSWLKSGEISASQLIATPLFNFTFQALNSEALFDVAVDVLCDLIHETQEVEDNMEAIQQIVPLLMPFRSELTQAISQGDDDKVRGFCRIFVQAGESYHHLILKHDKEFFPLVESIAQCSSYQDLEIVQITFRFWYLLASGLAKSRDDERLVPFLKLYQGLLDVIIKHLRFPKDGEDFNAQSRDEFREFRHVMGDTLKDCCHVLGSNVCLSRSLQLIQSTIGNGNQSFAWQDVEAPLFSMRAMGAEADPTDDEILPQIIDLIPTLPNHPKLNYAGLLVVSRYTEWIDLHPDRISPQLSYISAGLSSSDTQVAAAAAQAMNYLCQDCRRHLVPYLPQLYEFFSTVGEKLEPDELMAVSEAVGHVVAGMSVSEAIEPLMRFTQPVLQKIHSISAIEKNSVSKADLRSACDKMEQLEKFLQVVGNEFSDSLPETCFQTCAEAYSILDSILEKHHDTFFLSERCCSLIRRSLAFFGNLAIPTLPNLLQRMTSSFENTGFPGYIWIVGKVLDGFGNTQDANLSAIMSNAFQRTSSKVLSLMESIPPQELSDVLDDYLHTCLAVASRIPSLFFLSPVLPHAFRCALTGLTLYQPGLNEISLDLLREIVGHSSIQPASHQANSISSNGNGNGFSSISSPSDGKGDPNYSRPILQLLETGGYDLISLLLNGLISHFPSETLPLVIMNLRCLCLVLPLSQIQTWLETAVESLPNSNVGETDKREFLTNVARGLQTANREEIKIAITKLYQASRKARERARLDDAVLDR